MSESTHATSKKSACINCSRAKAKCDWTDADPDASACQRCFNKRLDCCQAEPGLKRKRGKSNRTKVIEQKLDDIILRLDRNSEDLTELKGSRGYLPRVSRTISSSSPIEANYLSTDWDQTSDDALTILPGYHMRLNEADMVLQEYMGTMTHQFPFVPIPLCKASSMLKETPLLLKTILWVCKPPPPSLNKSFETWFRQHIAHRVVVLMEKKLEFVQALLVFLAWKDIQFYACAHDTSLLQLTIGIADDLGLTKCPENPEVAFRSIVEDAAHLRNEFRARSRHSNAERRAALGIFYLTSVLSGLMRRRHKLEYTSYVQQCCMDLLQDQEFNTDSLLVHLIEVRKIGIRVDNTLSTRREAVNGKMLKVPFQWSHGLAITSAQKELDAYMAHLPKPFQSNCLLRENYTAIRVRLFESITHCNSSDDPELTLIRSRIMWDCLQSIHTLLDLFLAIPLESFPSLTFVSMLHLALAIIKAGALLRLDDHDWDKDLARQNLDLQQTLKQLSERFQEANQLGHPRCSSVMDDLPIFSAYAKNFNGIKEWYSPQSSQEINDLFSTLTDQLFYQGAEGAEFWQQLSGYSCERTL